MPPEIQRLVSQFLNDPIKIEVAKPSTTSSTITQNLIACSSDQAEKRDALRRAIRAEENFQNAIVFCNRKRDIGTLHRSLEKHGFKAVALHGDMDQRARMQALDQFKTGEAELLVASDVAARGLDIPAVSHVLNYDVPIHAEDYGHRSGRTGRAGLSGISITLVAPSDKRYLAAIEKLTGQDIPWRGEPAAESSGDGERSSRGKEGRGARRGRSSENRSERAEKPRQEPRQAAEEAPRERREEHPKTGHKAQKPHAKRERDQGRNRPRHDQDDGPTPVGMGDHVPQFLLRPVRLKGA
jgi:superfamily II DNA/RNA helicase